MQPQQRCFVTKPQDLSKAIRLSSPSFRPKVQLVAKTKVIFGSYTQLCNTNFVLGKVEGTQGNVSLKKITKIEARQDRKNREKHLSQNKKDALLAAKRYGTREGAPKIVVCNYHEIKMNA